MKKRQLANRGVGEGKLWPATQQLQVDTVGGIASAGFGWYNSCLLSRPLDVLIDIIVVALIVAKYLSLELEHLLTQEGCLGVQHLILPEKISLSLLELVHSPLGFFPTFSSSQSIPSALLLGCRTSFGAHR